MTDYSNKFIYHLTLKCFLLSMIILFIIFARDILIPLTIAVFFTFLLLPFSRYLEKKKFPRWLAAICAVIIAVIVLGALLYFFYLQIVSFSDDWPLLKKNIGGKITKLYAYIDEKFHVSAKDQEIWIKNRIYQTAESGDKIAMTIFSAITNFFANLVVIPLYIFFLTIYREKIKLFFALIFKNGEPSKLLPILTKVAAVSQKYLKGMFLGILILAVLNSVGFLLFDLQHAVLFGILAALLNVIPYIGVLVGSILPVTMALLNNDLSSALGAAGTCIAVQFLDNNFITPYVVGSSVSINPLAAILALLISGMIWGIAGMILCIPIVGMIKVICDNVEELKPYGFLIGEEELYKKRHKT